MFILAVVSRDLEKGSTKYRLAQYLDNLRRHGAEVEFIRRDAIDNAALDRARQADVLFNQKCLIRTSLAKRLIDVSRRVIFDFDDAIYTRPGKPFSWLTRLKVRRRFHLWLRHASVVTAPNEFLAGYARRYSKAVEVVPMSLDLGAWRQKEYRASERVTIGWAGAPVNVPLLERLDPILGRVLERFPQARLAVFSGRKPRLTVPFDYHPFRPGAEPDFVRGLDIGLLPLADEEYAQGKSPIKSLQYLACGVPVVGNVFGATAEILTPDNSIAVADEQQWLAALERLIPQPELTRQLGGAGRAMIERRHDLRRVSEKLYEVLAGR
jgi:glycosyltransferase involved in cell wall biosynthesis